MRGTFEPKPDPSRGSGPITYPLPPIHTRALDLEHSRQARKAYCKAAQGTVNPAVGPAFTLQFTSKGDSA
jgi:hypothetical protein